MHSVNRCETHLYIDCDFMTLILSLLSPYKMGVDRLCKLLQADSFKNKGASRW